MAHYSIETFPKDRDTFILDANVLIYLHGVDPDRKLVRKFSIVADKLIRSQSKVLLDSVILSEFINRYINGSLKKKKGYNVYFRKREHRNTPEYNKTLEELSLVLKQIEMTYNIEWIVDGYDFIKKVSSLNLKKTLNETEFNDYILIQLAKNKNAIIVTNDNDFRGVLGIDTLN